MVLERSLQKLLGVDARKGTSGERNTFKIRISRVRGPYVPVRMKGKAGISRDIETLVRKQK